MKAIEILDKTIQDYNSKVNDISKFKFNNREIGLFSNMMEEYASQFQQKWIKIESEEDLHNINSHCWVCTSNGGVYSYQVYTSIFPSLHNISHYMPIIKPEPPKED